MTRTLGFDPGLDVTGWALVTRAGGRPVLLESGSIRTAPGTPQPERLRAIAADVARTIRGTLPDLVAVEAFAFQGQARTRHAPSIVIPRIVERIIATAEAFDIATLELPRWQVCSVLTGCVTSAKVEVHRGAAFRLGIPGGDPRGFGQNLDERDAVATALVGEAIGRMGGAAPRARRPEPRKGVLP